MFYKIASYDKPILIISSLSDNTIQERLIEALSLKAQSAGIVDQTRCKDEFGFSAPPFRWSWNGFDLFNTVSKVRIRFTKPNTLIQLQVRFIFTELLLITLALSSTILLAALLGLILWAVILGLVIWGALVSISLFNMSRFVTWVEREVKAAELHALELAGDRQYTEKTVVKTELYSNV